MSDRLYLEQVRAAAALAKKGEPEIIYNKSLHHASILIGELIRSAEHEIAILSGCLNADVYDRDEVFNAIEAATRIKGMKLRVLLDGRRNETSAPSSKALEVIMKYGTNVTGSDKVVKHIENHDFDFHFIVVDRKAFRYEPNWERTEAFANFFDREVGERLYNWFDEVWNSAD